MQNYYYYYYYYQHHCYHYHHHHHHHHHYHYYYYNYYYHYYYSIEQTPSREANRPSGYSRNSPHFMEPESLSPHSQQPAICPYPE